MISLTLIFSNYGQDNQPFLVSWHRLLVTSKHLKVKVLSYQVAKKDVAIESFIPRGIFFKAYNLVKYWVSKIFGLNMPELTLPKLYEIGGVCHLSNAQLYSTVKPQLQEKVSVVVSFRGYETLVRINEDPKWRKRLFDVYETADALHFVSDYLKEASINLGAPAQKCHTIYRSVEADFFKPVPRLPHQNRPIVFSAGRLTWQKAYDQAIEAIYLVKQAGHPMLYRIAGSGEEEPKLRKLIAQFGLENDVEIISHVDHDQLRDLYQAADIFLVSSVTEALPNVILEASAMELPIVATHVGGIPEAVIHEKTGELVPASEPQAMADAILKLLKDETLRLQMGKAGRVYIQQKFAPQVILKQWEEFYGRI
jgi:glycosyltransferase involved in cell wall biosynthesis